MRTALGKSILICVALAALVACGRGEPQLMNIKASSTGPDEFQILPTKPLEEPENYTDLPAPTPGGANLTDPSPVADAVNALGGNAAAGVGLRGGEQALVSHASRYGVSSDIRQALAAEDVEWRRRNSGKLLERLFDVNVYYRAYEKMELDQYRELERLRRRGVWTPAVPPEAAQAAR